MTSKERLTVSLQHREPDRVPFDLSGTTVTSIHKKAYIRAMDQRGLSTDFQSKEIDPVQQIITPTEEVMVALKVDTRRIGARRVPSFEQLVNMDDETWEFTDQWHCVWRMRVNKDKHFRQISCPLDPKASLEEALEQYKMPVINDWRDEMNEDLSEQAGYLEDFGVIADRNCAGLTEMSVRLRGYEKWYLDTLNDEKGVGALLDMILSHKMEYWEVLARWMAENALTPAVQVCSECDDLGTKLSTMISPTTIRNLVLPRFNELWSHMKALFPDAMVFMHNEGAISSIFGELIDAGMEIYNPVDYTAKGMNLNCLKKEFGQDVVFWGGGVAPDLLVTGTTEQVSDEVKRVIDIMAPGGGFVFAPFNNIREEVPPENFWALWDTLMEYGRY
jgi:uroporphyrinogen decarboxylase